MELCSDFCGGENTIFPSFSLELGWLQEEGSQAPPIHDPSKTAPPNQQHQKAKKSNTSLTAPQQTPKHRTIVQTPPLWDVEILNNYRYFVKNNDELLWSVVVVVVVVVVLVANVRTAGDEEFAWFWRSACFRCWTCAGGGEVGWGGGNDNVPSTCTHVWCCAPEGGGFGVIMFLELVHLLKATHQKGMVSGG